MKTKTSKLDSQNYLMSHMPEGTAERMLPSGTNSLWEHQIKTR